MSYAQAMQSDPFNLWLHLYPHPSSRSYDRHETHDLDHCIERSKKDPKAPPFDKSKLLSAAVGVPSKPSDPAVERGV